MKHFPLLLIAIVSLLSVVSGCEERVDPDDLLGSYASGSATATQNGKLWKANAFMDMEPHLPGHYALAVTRFNNQGFARENFGFSRISPNKNRQEIYPSIPEIDRVSDTVRGFYTTVLDDGDVGGDFYIIDRDGYDNWVQITEFDQENNRIKGRFEIHLILAENQGNIEPNAPERIGFVNGTFDVRAPDDFAFD